MTQQRMTYFASRSAAMGQVPAETVIATFFNFNPALIRQAIPAAWDIATTACPGLTCLTSCCGTLRRCCRTSRRR